MFAVFQSGGKQYRAAADDVLTIGKIEGEPGEIVSFGEVLLVGGDNPSVGLPNVSGATVAAEIVRHERGDKVIAFKKRRRQNSKRKRGHRQDFTVVRITEILTGGAQPDRTRRERPAKAKPAETQSTEASAGGEAASA